MKNKLPFMKKVSAYFGKHPRGFTLVELLVVMSIISILASIVTVSVIGAKAKGNDAKRKSDLYTIKTALHLYFADQNPNIYPTSASAAEVTSTLFGSDQSYIKTVPTDPKDPDRKYLYISDANSLNFVLSCDLENDNDGDRNSAPTGYTITGDYFIQND